MNERERAFTGSVYVHDLLGIPNETFLGAPRASEYYISILRYVIFYPKGRIGIVNRVLPMHITKVLTVSISTRDPVKREPLTTTSIVSITGTALVRVYWAG